MALYFYFLDIFKQDKIIKLCGLKNSLYDVYVDKNLFKILITIVKQNKK